MVSIVSENPALEKEIKGLLNTLVDAGTGIHSQLVIEEQGGGLSIKTAEPMDRDKEIIRLPRTVLMPGDQYLVDIKDKNFIIHYPETSIVSDLQRRVINSMYEIYNLCNKVRLHEQYSFLLSMRGCFPLLDYMATERDFISGPYKEWVQMLRMGPSDEQYRKVVANTYVKTRPLGYSDHIRESSVSMIMPILDFMNHHWEGGFFAVGQAGTRKGDLVMHSSQPIKGSKECYANYGVMDAFDSLVRYDFVDEFAPIIRSVSLDFEGPAGDLIRVGSSQGFTFNTELKPEMQDLRRYIPDIKVKEGALEVSHLIIPSGASVLALARVLNMVIREYNQLHSKTMSEPEIRAWRARMQQHVIEKNKAFYAGMLDFVAKLPAEQRDSFCVSRVKGMAELQQRKLGVYEIQY